MMIKNIFYLFLNRGSRFVIPFFVYPYLIKVVGIENFGEMMFVQNFILYFNYLIEYGFGLSIVKLLPFYESKKKLSILISNVFYSKIILFAIGFLLFLFIIYNFNFTNKFLYFYSYLYCLGQVFNMFFLYQGKENVKIISILNILNNLIVLILVYLLINGKDDYYIYLIINSACFLITNMIGFFLSFKLFNWQLFFPLFKYIKKYLSSGWFSFLSVVTYNYSYNSVIFFLGIATTKEIVGYFISIERLIFLISNLFSPIYQILYPKIAKIYLNSKKKGFAFNVKIVILLYILVSILIFFLFQEKKLLFEYLFKNDEINLKIVNNMFYLFIMYPYFNIVYNLIVSQNLVILNLDKFFFKISLYVFVVSILLIIVLIKYFSYVGGIIGLLTYNFILIVIAIYKILKEIYNDS